MFRRSFRFHLFTLSACRSSQSLRLQINRARAAQQTLSPQTLSKHDDHHRPSIRIRVRRRAVYRTMTVTRTRGRVRSMVLGGRGPDLGVLPRVARSGAGEAEPRGSGQPPTALQEVSRLSQGIKIY